MTTIDYFMIGASPFSYLGHQAIQDVAAKHQAKLQIKPIDLMAVWEVSGGIPLPQRTAMRQRYRFLELQRSADIRGLPLNLKPKFFPVNPTMSDCCIIAIIESGASPLEYMDLAYRGVWVDEADMADKNEISIRLEKAGFEAAAILSGAKSDGVATIRAANTAEAIEKDAVGAPAFVVDGEVFWGQDRIEHIDHMLETGRKAFSVPE